MVDKNIDEGFLLEASKNSGGTKIVLGDAIYFNGKKYFSEEEYEAATGVVQDEINFLEEETKEEQPVKEETKATNYELPGIEELFETFEDAVETGNEVYPEETETETETVQDTVEEKKLEEDLVEKEEPVETKEESIEEKENEIVGEEKKESLYDSLIKKPMVVKYDAVREEFEDDMDDIEPAKFVYKQDMKPADVSKVIKNIDKIAAAFEEGLADIKLATGTLVGKTENERFISKTQNPYTVIALNSGYKALMGGLTYKEINSLRGNSVSNYEKRQKLFKLLYSKIEGMNFKKPSYEQFIKMTAMADLDTLLFGVYAKTHLTKSELTIRCSNSDCNKQFKYTVANENLVQLYTLESAYELINKLEDPTLNQVEVTKQYSLVTTTSDVFLKDLGIALKIGLPSLEIMLKTFKLIEGAKEEDQEIYASSIYIKEMLVPNYKVLEETGKVEFYKLTDLNDIVNYISKMTIVQIKTFLKELGKFMDKYKMTYAIKEVQCPHCKEIQEEVPVDIETLLFLGITM